MTKFNCVLLIFVCLITVSQNIFADQILLKSGDRLSGKIVKQDDQTIILKTDFAGVLTISKSVIEKISIDQSAANEAIAINEKAATGPQISENTESQTAVKTDASSANEKTETTTAATANPAVNSAARFPRKRGLFFNGGWDGTANLGFSLTSGNSKTKTLTAGLRAEKSRDKDKWTTYLNALWNKNRVAGVDLTTSNALWGGVRYDRNITKKWFAFGSFDFEHDKPQLLNFRSVLGAGLGYHAIKNDRTELDIFSGAAWNRSDYVTLTRTSAEVLIGNTLKHKFNERVKFQQGFTFYPNLTESGEYRFIFDSTLSADVTKRIGYFVTFGDRYNSFPLAGVLKNDLLLTTGLKWSFGKVK